MAFDETELATRAGRGVSVANPAPSWLARACPHLPYGLLLLASDFTVPFHLGWPLPPNYPVQLRSGRLVLPQQVRRRVQLLMSDESASGPALIKVHDADTTVASLVFQRVDDEDAAPTMWRVGVFTEGGVVPKSEALRLTYRMTPCEAGVVRQLVAGRSLLVAAKNLRISHETARAHLKSAFHKVNVRGQAALVARILSGPAVVLGHDRVSNSPNAWC